MELTKWVGKADWLQRCISKWEITDF